MKVLAVLLRLAHDEAVDVATEEVARCYCQPEAEDLWQVGKGEVCWYAQIEEGICHTMWETAVYEDWYAEEHRQVLAFAGEGDNSGHYETAADGQYAALDGT